MRIAIYDLDKTLTRKATFTPFLVFAARRIAPLRLAFLPVWVAAMLGYKAGLYDRTRLKRFGMRLMLGRVDLPRLRELGAEFARVRLEGNGMMPATKALMGEDREEGAQLAIATAAFAFYAEAFAEGLGIDTVIGTRWDGADIPGGNCYGAEKASRVAAWLEQLGVMREPMHIRFVSDSFADAALLDMADEGIFIAHGNVGAAKAQARGWHVVMAD